MILASVCGAPTSVPDTDSGALISIPNCDKEIVVPLLDALIELSVSSIY